ncbi:MAG: 6-bladed beta-propeller [Candidatus Azobacteroides sp.]|nr:6-bladed beta-propeller [Candidatus Azobacteroides sp.]
MRRIFRAFSMTCVILLCSCSGKEHRYEKEENTSCFSDSLSLSHGYLDLSPEVEPEVEIIPLHLDPEINLPDIDRIFFQQGNYYLISKEASAIYKFTEKGKYVSTLTGTPKEEEGYTCLDACYLHNGNIWIADNSQRKVFCYDKNFNFLATYEIPRESHHFPDSDYEVKQMWYLPKYNVIYLINYFTQIAEVKVFDILLAFEGDSINSIQQLTQKANPSILPLKRRTDRFIFPVNLFLLPAQKEDTVKIYTELDGTTKQFLYNNIQEFIHLPGTKIIVRFKQDEKSRFIYHNYEPKTSILYEGFTHRELGDTYFVSATFEENTNIIYALWNSPFFFPTSLKTDALQNISEKKFQESKGLPEKDMSDRKQPVIIKCKIKEESFLNKAHS